jgi:hypothetical protein
MTTKDLRTEVAELEHKLEMVRSYLDKIIEATEDVNYRADVDPENIIENCAPFRIGQIQALAEIIKAQI